MQENCVHSLGWDDPLEEEMATHSNILAWEIPWAEEPGGLQSRELQIVGQDLVTEHTYSYLSAHHLGFSTVALLAFWNIHLFVKGCRIDTYLLRDAE